MFAGRNHIDKYRNDGCVIPANVLEGCNEAVPLAHDTCVDSANRPFDGRLRRGD